MTIKAANKKPAGKPRKVELTLAPGEVALVIREGAFYKLGYPLDDQVFSTHILKDAREMVWDTLEQEWLETSNKGNL